MKEKEYQKSTQDSSKRKTTMELLKEAGFVYKQKEGAILMPLSKKQRESMTKSQEGQDQQRFREKEEQIIEGNNGGV